MLYRVYGAGCVAIRARNQRNQAASAKKRGANPAQTQVTAAVACRARPTLKGRLYRQ